MAPPRESVFLAAPLATGRGGIIASPFQFIFTGEDHLRVATVNVASGRRIVIQGRWLADGAAQVDSFSAAFDMTASGIEQRQRIPMGKGVLLNLVALATAGLVLPGQCFVRVDVMRGLDAQLLLGTLISGYVGSWGPLAWPGSVLQQPTDGPGWPNLVLSTTPAAGFAPSITVPEETKWRVQSARVQLTTDATPGNRTIFLELVEQNNVIETLPPSQVQPPSTTFTYTWSAAGGRDNAVSPIHSSGSLASPAYLTDFGGGNSRVRIATIGLQPADQFTELRVMTEEWRHPVTVF